MHALPSLHALSHLLCYSTPPYTPISLIYMLTNTTYALLQLLYFHYNSHVLYASLQCVSSPHIVAFTAYVLAQHCYTTTPTCIITTSLVFAHISPVYTINTLHMHSTALTFHHHTCTFSVSLSACGTSYHFHTPVLYDISIILAHLLLC